MSKKNQNNKESSKLNIFKNLKEETIQGVLAVAFFAIAVFLSFSSLQKGGVVGKYTFKVLNELFGMGYFLIPLLLIALGISFIKSAHKHLVITQIIGSTIFFISGLAMISLISPNSGGIIGKWTSTPLIQLFNKPVSFVILLATILISILIVSDTPLSFPSLEKLAFWKRFKKNKNKEPKIIGAEETNGLVESAIAHERNAEKESENNDFGNKQPMIKKSEEVKKTLDSDFKIKSQYPTAQKPFTPPPLSLLEHDKGKPGVGDIKANSNIIKRTLQNFGITVEMDEISIGPSVTRYALKPAEGVKLSRIVGLQNDLALALAAHPIRIEAPIPGKSLVGIEIPNSTKTTVGLASLLSAEDYQKSDKPLLVALGKGVSGKCHFGNLAKMPHILIAGATGSGKSVTIHTLIASLLYRNPPENLKFIMIDPKRVELTLYNKTPHLLTPVITEAKKAILALKWAAKEMDRRYDILESESVRDIESYHKNILEPELKKLAGNPRGNEKIDESEPKLPETMPYIVIVLDELADIMTTYPRELEAAIVRLAQMSRAVGIHLILSTQRPSVNVITGLIKANVPSRIALQVASQIDSRTILDTGGAEKLLGAGDMLYMSGEMSKPARIQSAFISENEVKKIVKYLSDTYMDEIPSGIDITSAENGRNVLFEGNISSEENGDTEEDELYEEAREIIIHAGKASTSYLQRKLRVGYARAARLIDMLEERGVIAPGDGAKPREILEKSESKDFEAEEESNTTSS